MNSLAIEQHNDVILQHIRLEILKEDFSEAILLQDNRNKPYSR